MNAVMCLQPRLCLKVRHVPAARRQRSLCTGGATAIGTAAAVCVAAAAAAAAARSAALLLGRCLATRCAVAASLRGRGAAGAGAEPQLRLPRRARRPAARCGRSCAGRRFCCRTPAAAIGAVGAIAAAAVAGSA